MVVYVERAGALSLQWAWCASADSKRGDLGVQQVVHTVHSNVHLRLASMAGGTGHPRSRLFCRCPGYYFISCLCRTARTGKGCNAAQTSLLLSMFEVASGMSGPW